MSDRLTLVDPCTLAQIGLAIAGQLGLVFPAAKFHHEWIPARVSAQQWTELMRRTPFVGVGWGELEQTATRRSFNGHTSFSVFLATRNPNGVKARYVGDRFGPGLLAMVQAGVAILHGHSIADIGLLQVQKAANVYADDWRDDQVAMATLDVTCTVSLPLADVIAGVTVDALAALGIDWSFSGADAPIALSDVQSTGGNQ